MLKRSFQAIFSVLIYFPCAALVFWVFGPYGLIPLRPLALPIFIGMYASALLTIWTITDSEAWRTSRVSWDADQGAGIAAPLMLIVRFALGPAVSLGFGWMASGLLSSSIYGAVVLGYNGIPASVATALILSGKIQKPSIGAEGQRDLAVLVMIGGVAVVLSEMPPFLLFPWLLGFEVVAAITYAVLRSSIARKHNTRNNNMTIAILVAGALLIMASQVMIARSTAGLYLGSLKTW
jgi:hypothetical protein